MVSTAKLFKNGQSQAVRLPKEYRFNGEKEVYIKKIDNTIILFPKDKKMIWQDMFNGLDGFSDDFMQERTEPKQNREEIF